MAYYGNEPAKVALKVGSGVITAEEIQDASISTADIANDAITPNQLDDDGTGFQVGTLGVGAAVSGGHGLVVSGTSSFSGNINGTNFVSGANSNYYLDPDGTSNIYAVNMYANSQVVGSATFTVGTGAATFGGDVSVSSSDPTITIKRSNNVEFAGHIDFTNNADTLGWQIGTNQVTGDGFEANYQGSNKLYVSTTGNATFGGNISSSAGNIDIAATKKIFLDGGGDTYIQEDSANNILFQSSTANFAGDLTITSELFITNRGSASAPAIRFGGDGSSGIYSGSSAEFGYAHGGSQKFLVDSSGDGTFAGAVQVGASTAYGNTTEVLTLKNASTGGTKIAFWNNQGSNARSEIHNNVIDAGSNSYDDSQLLFKTSSDDTLSTVLTLAHDKSATFAGALIVTPPDGTTASLHMNAGGNGNAELLLDAGTTGRHPYVQFQHDGTAYWTVKSDPDDSRAFAIQDNQNSNVSQFKIASGGNATFAGDVNVSGQKIRISNSSTNAKIEIDSGGGHDAWIDIAKGSVNWTIQNTGALSFRHEGSEKMNLNSSGDATFGGKVGIDSGGYTQKQLHIGDEGHMLLSHGTDTIGEYAGIFMRAEGGEENGMLRTKGLIAFERTGAWGVGDMKFCILGDANNSAVTTSNVVLKLDSSSNATFAGDVTTGNGAIRQWLNLGAGSTHVTTSGAYKIQVKTKRAGNTNYYKGFILELFASGGYDWSGHGYVTAHVKLLITVSSTTSYRVHILENKGYSYLNNNQNNLIYANDWTDSYDTDYAILNLKFSSNETGTGWKPNWSAITYDASGNDMVYSVAVIN